MRYHCGMAEVKWHTGTTSDSSELAHADYYHAIRREDDEIVLVFQNGERKGPFKGEAARKDRAALEAAKFESIRYRR